MNILLTGAFGNVGLSTLNELLKLNYKIRVFEIKNRKNKKIAKTYKNRVEILWGDLRDYRSVEKAIQNQDIIIHLAAIIPPLADFNPKLAEQVNVGGTVNIIEAMKNQEKKPKIVFTSSIAVYGDRRENPLIKISDPLKPSKDDFYALTKISAEKAIRDSGLDFVIFRLSYITSVEKLDMDPLMFHMPLDTSIEICDTKDVGYALARAVENKEIWGETLHIAGGTKCRTSYKEYLNNMMEIFGLGKDFFPEVAFAKNDFHCGFMDTMQSQEKLNYQHHTLDDYYNEVRKKVGSKKYFMPLVRWMVKIHLLKKSDPYRRSRFFKRKSGAFSVSENKFIRRILSNNFRRIEALEKELAEIRALITNLGLKNLNESINEPSCVADSKYYSIDMK